MTPKRSTHTFSVRQSDGRDSWVYDRVHRALLRSTGHSKKDGHWVDGPDDFHRYMEAEPAVLGKLVHFDASAFNLNHLSGDWFAVEHGSFRTSVSRNYSSGFFGEESRVLINPVEPDFSDFVLDLNNQGTHWIRLNRPGNPVAQLGQFVGELHDLPRLPIFMRSRAKTFADLGSEYLNIEFGWKPFIKDLVKVYNLQRELSNRLEKLVRDNGISVRRRSKKVENHIGSVPICDGLLSAPWGHLGDTSIGGNIALDGYRVGGFLGSTDYGFDPGVGECYYLYETRTDTVAWNCGTFRYYVPDIGSNQWTQRAISALHGVDVTPAVIWELLPWSWLIDWFANVGDILSNLSTNAVDNESLTNCYSMKTVTDRHIVTVDSRWNSYTAGSPGDLFYASIPAGDDHLVYVRTHSNKLRHQASPYGFGLDSASFSAGQWAILAALGVSRVKH